MKKITASICMELSGVLCQLDNSNEELLTLQGRDRKRIYMKLDSPIIRSDFFVDCGSTVNLIFSVWWSRPIRKDLVCDPEVDTEDVWRQHAEDRSHSDLGGQAPQNEATWKVQLLYKGDAQPLIGLEASLQFDLLSINDENICAINLNDKVYITHEFVYMNYKALKATRTWMANCIWM